MWYSPGRSSTGPPRDADRDTVWRFFVTFFCTGGAGSVTAGAAADFVASCASAGAIAVAAGTAKAAVPDWLAAISSSW